MASSIRPRTPARSRRRRAVGLAPTSESRRSPAGRATFPVVELFGPTVQGEGPDAGRPAYFVRFGGCDYRCSWCDSMHAVEPDLVRRAERMDTRDVIEGLAALARGPQLVILSGGNPALLQLGELVDELHAIGMRVAVETQGSLWRDWLGQVDRVVVSPKPPSSGMVSPEHAAQTAAFMKKLAVSEVNAALKVVVFDDNDLAWAQDLADTYRYLPLFLSAGTDVGMSDADTVAIVRRRFAWLAEAVAARPALADARVLPQLHVIAWGTAKGV